MGFFAWLFRRKPKKLKIGLALGSGGAKGFAELGALKAFEEAGIEFDVISGSSIGSIIGAFYADGYSVTDITEMIKSINPGSIMNGILMNMDMTGLKNVIDRELGEKNIEELKKPFCAVATEIESSQDKAFTSGNTAIALCASASIPPFFKPVFIDGVRYVDGAFSNSIPADYLRKMGADYVVGIDLSTRDSKPNLLTKIFPTYESKVEIPWQKGYDNSDVMLHPDLTGFKSTSFKSANQMYEIGYRHALSFVPKIKEDLSRLKVK